jgi:hypothetical protein
MVVVLSIVTCGIFHVLWLVGTKDEANRFAGTSIPSGWWLLVPIANIFWLSKLGHGVEQMTNGRLSSFGAFMLLWLLGPIGCAIVQSHINDAIDEVRIPRAQVA